MKKVNRILYLALILFFGACSHSSDSPQLAQEMREIHSTLNSLYMFTWDEAAFNASQNEHTISKLLSNFSDRFHRVEEVAKEQAIEPGFRAALESEVEIVHDIQQRFRAGDKEDARKRLIRITENCISCHSRFGAATNLFGHFPPPITSGIESVNAEVEYFFATRQFDKASEQLYSQAKRRASGAMYDKLESLKLLLVIRLRVESNPSGAAHELAGLLKEASFSERDSAIIRSWIEQLALIGNDHLRNREPVSWAMELLGDMRDSTSHANDEERLPSTLYATKLLHEILQTSLEPHRRREASVLLAMSYFHLPIDHFQTMRDECLRQVALEFPGTPEAERVRELSARNLTP